MHASETRQDMIVQNCHMPRVQYSKSDRPSLQTGHAECMHDGRRTRHLSVPARQPRQPVKDMHMRAEEAWSGEERMFMQDPVFAGKSMCGCLSSTKACFVCVLPRSGECVVLEVLMGWVVRDRGLGVRNRSQRVRDAGDIPPLDHDGRTLGGRASVSVVEKVDVRGGIVVVGSCKCMLGTGVVLRRSYWSTKEGSGRSRSSKAKTWA
jgi:hypothetical protein